MNIQQAKDQIRGAVTAYLSKDDFGRYRIPRHMQRPIIMLGPPGVGKTAIVAQVAREMGINYVSYSITHHTRQTALGLPFIVERVYGGKSYQVSEYTMSEIIGAVHDARERSGVLEGILFLDEVNCVSETLAPAMLQFLQYKTFGQHELPEGWIIVTAGNPPEYNKSAREFDPAMMDRMKCMLVEPDVKVWLQYAAAQGVHPAVIGYLEAKPAGFYVVRADVRGMRLVTARGWEDLSRMLLAYEAEGLAVDEALVAQYLQDDDTSRDFTIHYELFCKYRDEYRVDEILEHGAGGPFASRAAAAPFDEHMAVVGLLADAVVARIRNAEAQQRALVAVRSDVLDVRAALNAGSNDALDRRIAVLEEESGCRAASRQPEAWELMRLHVLSELRHDAARALAEARPAYDAVREAFNERCAQQAAVADGAQCAIDNAFSFIDDAYGAQSQEGLVFTTRLSADPDAVSFVASRRIASYLAHNKGLLVEDRKKQLLESIREEGKEA